MRANLKLLLSQPLSGHVSDRHRRRVQGGSKLLSVMILRQGGTWGSYYFIKDNAFLMSMCRFATSLFYAGSKMGSSQLQLLPPFEVREIGVWINHGLACPCRLRSLMRW